MKKQLSRLFIAMLGDLWTTGVVDPDMEAPLLELGWRKVRGGVEDVLFVAGEDAQ